MSTPATMQKTMNGVHYYWAHFFAIILSTMLSTILYSSLWLHANEEEFGLMFVVFGLFTLAGGIPCSLLIEHYLKRNNIYVYAVKAVLYPAAGVLLVYLFIQLIGGTARLLFYSYTGTLMVYAGLLQSWVYFLFYSVICFLVRRSLQRRDGLVGEEASEASEE
ncbi:hypothetical protein [Paenibacillus kobensis]|uniref:hypothetical protein n=1 Tax=Paenibacillus kobensis TaxID=59841 RepID=UPI000FDA23D2|nr:hypothetical protein [Paenibacillus kobensis]